MALVVGARPNFVKLAPLINVLQKDGRLGFRIVHTGQHYDHGMSDSFFDVMGIPSPDVNLEVGSSSHARQVGKIMERFEDWLKLERPEIVVVFGDVNSTMACALTSVKLLVPVVHVEAGLRSFDRTMPEEVNRIVTDSVSDLLLATEPSGVENLRNEGHQDASVRLVGNIMIDSLLEFRSLAQMRKTYTRLGVRSREYALLTMHRPTNVDNDDILAALWKCFRDIAASIPIVFPVHPRTLERLEKIGLASNGNANLHVIGPVDYLDAICLEEHARFVMTDSGGMQEETSVLGVPCLTLRDNTERPITVSSGTATLVGSCPERIRGSVEDILQGRYKKGMPIPLWDGRTGGRVASVIKEYFQL